MDRRRKQRVVESHRIASAALRLAGAFAVVAAGWAIVVAIGGGSWWGPVHSALAGAVLLAISGISQMFTITWAAAPAPERWLPVSQRWALAVGIAAVLVGVVRGIDWLVILGATLALVGLVLLATSLLGAVRRSLLRRFDLSSRFYFLAIACGVLGITLGAIVGAGLVTDLDMVVAHAHLNLVGLIGFTITGTLPTFLPTLAHHPTVSGDEAIAALWLAVAAAIAMAAGVFFGPGSVGVGVGVSGIAMAVILIGAVYRLGWRGADLGGLAYLQVVLGCAWLVVWAVVDAMRLLDEGLVRVLDAWTSAAVVAGIAQVMVGALAYLLPVLAGPAPRLGRNLARMDTRRWVPLGAANLAGIAFVVGAPAVAGAAGAVWFVDVAWRLTRLEWRTISE